jgi:hypothetical protein
MSRPTAAECTTYRTRYEEADQALHKLRTGSKTESIRMGEKQVLYTRASVGELVAYVSWLKSKVDACDGKSVKSRMIGVIPTN